MICVLLFPFSSKWHSKSESPSASSLLPHHIDQPLAATSLCCSEELPFAFPLQNRFRPASRRPEILSQLHYTCLTTDEAFQGYSGWLCKPGFAYQVFAHS